MHLTVCCDGVVSILRNSMSNTRYHRPVLLLFTLLAIISVHCSFLGVDLPLVRVLSDFCAEDFSFVLDFILVLLQKFTNLV